jgi:hypothetical protein
VKGDGEGGRVKDEGGRGKGEGGRGGESTSSKITDKGLPYKIIVDVIQEDRRGEHLGNRLPP